MASMKMALRKHDLLLILLSVDIFGLVLPKFFLKN